MFTVKYSLHKGHRSITINYIVKNDCDLQEIDWRDCGVTLRTKWHFRQGAEVELGLEVDRKRYFCLGVVVACQALDEPECYRTTLFFVEPPCDEIQRTARSMCGELCGEEADGEWPQSRRTERGRRLGG